MRKSWHSSPAAGNDGADLFGVQALTDIEKPGKCGRRAFAVGTVTSSALLLIERRPKVRILDLMRCRHQPACPGHVVTVNINHTRPSIDSRATPFCAAIQPWKHHRLPAHRQRCERALVIELVKLLQRGDAGLQRPICEQIDRQSLTGEWCGLSCKGLVGEACSPGTSLVGTGRSSIGNNGLPVTRSNTNIMPCFEPCATASIILPL